MKQDKELFIEESGQNVDENYKTQSPFKMIIKRFLKDKLAIAGLIMLVVILFLILVVPIFTKDPSAIDIVMKNKPPSSEHILGTDALGRDVFARVLEGGRFSFFVGFLATIISVFLGTIFGLIAGYYGGVVDMIN